jgi:hypothetical protein
MDLEQLDEAADEATAGLDDSERERIQQRVAATNAVYGATDRVRKLSEDVVQHWAARSAEMRKFIGVPGKGMIVCATREICADLYERIIGLVQRRHRQGNYQGRLHRRRNPSSRARSSARETCAHTRTGCPARSGRRPEATRRRIASSSAS